MVEPGVRVEADVQNLFSTPVAQLDIPDAAALNENLRHAVLDRERSVPSVHYSNLGGWQSPADLNDWGGEAAKAVLNGATALANMLTCDREGKPVNVAWKVRAWANVNRLSDANVFHTHPGAYWSATYYVDDGGIDVDESLGGEFEIQDPRGIAPAMYAPLLALSSPGGLSVGANELIRPKSGRLIMFPSWLSHGVRPYRGAAERISLALNFSL